MVSDHAKRTVNHCQVAAGMGDAVNEAELTALIKGLTSVTKPDGNRLKGGVGRNEELDFYDFVRLFRGFF